MSARGISALTYVHIWDWKLRGGRAGSIWKGTGVDSHHVDGKTFVPKAMQSRHTYANCFKIHGHAVTPWTSYSLWGPYSADERSIIVRVLHRDASLLSWSQSWILDAFPRVLETSCHVYNTISPPSPLGSNFSTILGCIESSARELCSTLGRESFQNLAFER